MSLKNSIIRAFGYRAALLFGDPLMLDRWHYVCRYLPVTRDGQRLFDVGSGSGAFTLGAARRGYDAVGLSWDERDQATATERARICGQTARFPIGDARRLETYGEHVGAYDYVLNLENIEHIIDDRKLMRDLAACLKPGGWLILTTPNHNYRPITSADEGPFSKVEDGWHVRRGYTPAMLRELAADAGLQVEAIEGCSGFLSQKLTVPFRKIKPAMLGWIAILPFRVLPLLFDRLIARLTGYPDFSITLVAYKPRFTPTANPANGPASGQA